MTKIRSRLDPNRNVFPLETFSLEKKMRKKRVRLASENLPSGSVPGWTHDWQAAWRSINRLSDISINWKNKFYPKNLIHKEAPSSIIHQKATPHSDEEEGLGKTCSQSNLAAIFRLNLTALSLSLVPSGRSRRLVTCPAVSPGQAQQNLEVIWLVGRRHRRREFIFLMNKKCDLHLRVPRWEKWIRECKLSRFYSKVCKNNWMYLLLFCVQSVLNFKFYWILNNKFWLTIADFFNQSHFVLINHMSNTLFNHDIKPCC